MQLLQKQIAGAPVAAQQRRSRVQNARQTHVRVQAAAATEVKLNTKMSDEVRREHSAAAAVADNGLRLIHSRSSMHEPLIIINSIAYLHHLQIIKEAKELLPGGVNSPGAK